jgi:poly(hydroxyalkanoate) granule-associated protein
MVTKLKKGAAAGAGDDAKSSAQLGSTVKESAQQIWLAGLGAFSKAQEEGGKVFEALVKEGMTIQRKTQAAAGEKLNEATARMTSMASDLSSKASGQWDKLESIFEERVSRALKKLGVPSARDLEELNARIEQLQRAVSGVNARGTKGTAAKKAPAKAPRKRAAKRPSSE